MKKEETKEIQVKVPADIMTVQLKELSDKLYYESEVRKLLQGFIRSQLVKGSDYGTIEGETRTGGKFKSKLTLFKSGSEKFMSLFGWKASFRRDIDTWEMLGSKAGTICYICELFDKTGEKKGEGRGCADVNESRIKGDVNKGVKLAEKRSQLDAVLRTGTISELFIPEDKEDKEDQGNDYQQNQNQIIIHNNVTVSNKPDPLQIAKNNLIRQINMSDTEDALLKLKPRLDSAKDVLKLVDFEMLEKVFKTKLGNIKTIFT